MGRLPGGELSGRPLHFFWIIDCSSSMRGSKIQVVNNAIREAIPELRRMAESNPHVKVFMRCIKYADDAQWHIGRATPIEVFQWLDVTVGGLSNMGKALHLLTEELKILPMDVRGLPPALVLVSGSPSTDKVSPHIKDLMDVPWGRKAVRLAVGIGGDADYDTLQKFIGNPEIRPLQASNMEAITDYIKFSSSAALRSASAPAILPIDKTLTTSTYTPPLPPPIFEPKRMSALKIFFSYAHKDETQLKVIQKHLSHLKYQGLVTEWYDRDISAGIDWEREIEHHLHTADIILLLISPDFIASPYCYGYEMMRALEKHRLGEARVIPIILRSADWESTPVGRLQALPTNGKPIASWRKSDDAFLIVTQGVRKVIEELNSKKAEEMNMGDVW